MHAPIDAKAGHHQSWTLSFSDIKNGLGASISFLLFQSNDRFNRRADAIIHVHKKKDSLESEKILVKKSFDLSAFSSTVTGAISEKNWLIQLANSSLSPSQTKGELVLKNKAIKWNLKYNPRHHQEFLPVPKTLSNLGLFPGNLISLETDLCLTGSLTINKKYYEMQGGTGRLINKKGRYQNLSWTTAYCNSFFDAKGNQAPIIFEAWQATSNVVGNFFGSIVGQSLGSIISPRFTSFYFFYDNQTFVFNSFVDSLRVQSNSSISEWQFQADRNEFSFKGNIQNRIKDFSGLITEDTDGSQIYTSSSFLSDMTLLVYRSGNLIDTFTAQNTVHFESSSRSKTPYVSFNA